MYEPLEVKARHFSYTVSTLDEFREMMSDLGVTDGHARRRVTEMLKEGTILKWFENIGEKEIAEFLQKFRKSSYWKFEMAFRMAYTRKKYPRITFDKMAGYHAHREFVGSIIDNGKKNSLKLKEYGLKPGFGILLYGPPGCGKTHLVRCISGSTKRPMLKVPLDMFYHQGEMVIEFMREFEDGILFIDEMEALSSDRVEFEYKRNDSNNTLALINDEYFEQGNVMIGSTNSPWTIDSALLRSGRLDTLVYMGFPKYEDRLELLKYYMKNVECADVDFEELAKKTKFFSSSDFANFVRGVVHSKLVEGECSEINHLDMLAYLKTFCPTSVPWLENACGLNFSNYHRLRFGDMVDEIEEYKAEKNSLNYFV